MQRFVNPIGSATVSNTKGLVANLCRTKAKHSSLISPQTASIVSPYFKMQPWGMPILSTSKIAEEDNLLMFHKRGGYIFHIPTNTCTPFIKRLGVYFVQLRVPKELKTDFGRPDA